MVDSRPPLSEPVPDYDAGDPEQVERARAAAKLREAHRDDAVRQLLSTPGGRDWIWLVLGRANIFSTTFVSGDPHASAFAEGARNLGLSLLADLMRVEPNAYIVMQREAANG